MQDIHADAPLTREQINAVKAMSKAELVALYNSESRRLAGSREAHLVDESCKPGFIIGLFAFLKRRYTQFNQGSLMYDVVPDVSSDAEKPGHDLGTSGALHGSKAFSVTR